MRSFLAWVGGKSRIAKSIAAMIPDHRCYVEPFAGASWVLFQKKPSPVEIINDVNPELIRLYRAVKSHTEEFLRLCDDVAVSREQWDDFLRQDVERLTDLQRAVRFYYLVKSSFSSKLDFSSFGISCTRPPRFNVAKARTELQAVKERLSGVWIENRSYRDVIKRFDRPDTFFYVDPPYHGTEDYYGEGLFAEGDFTVLRAMLGTLKGRFLMSINDTPYIRELFSGFCVKGIDTVYAISSCGDIPVSELLVANYDLPD